MRATSSTLAPCHPSPTGNGQAETAQLPHRFRAWSKIQARHRDRMAKVYVRQSSPQQVKDHRESGDLQVSARRSQPPAPAARRQPADRSSMKPECLSDIGVAGRHAFFVAFARRL